MPQSPPVPSFYPSQSLYAHFKHLVASCASLHSNPHTLAPHFLHFIVPQYPQLSQNCLCGGPPAGGGAAWLAAYDNGGAARSASSSAGFSGGGIARSIDSSASSLPKSVLMEEDEACGMEGPGVASDGVGGTEANVLCRRCDCALLREAVVAPRGTGACCCCASWASSSSSQCLIWR
jgi:hypothetical protein